ncbi:EXOSTOSIN HEPARAN SULFATE GLYCOSYLTRANSFERASE -RELATED [Salix purpurea]|uniref:EXOSTOSIN HEPARAN SULFATE GLYCOSYLTRANSFERASE -RELATED n=1 Tax=Salix purpurea TaxID=77065 RepID=A0A9Q0Q4U1_SALPP|nr:EXOSTOSIN HEPARAN SULFATE GLYCOSYLTRANSFERASE -RELATED [Salix purpurea]
MKTGFESIEDGLARARDAILRAIRSRNSSSYKKGSYIPRGVIYRNQDAFHQLSLELKFLSLHCACSNIFISSLDFTPLHTCFFPQQ